MPRPGVLPSLAVLFALSLPSVGSAVLVRRTAGEFFAQAKSIELLRVVEVVKGRLKATVLRRWRGTAKRGATLALAGPMMATPTVGQEILRACGRRFCIWGLPRGGKHGYFEIHTDFYGHATIHIPPGIIERRALPLFAAKKSPPALCLNVAVRFSDAPKATARFALTLDAATGLGRLIAAPAVAGTLARRLLSSPPAQVRVLTREGQTSVAARLSNGSWVTLSGGLPTRSDTSGCYALSSWASTPFARTPRTLRRALAGKAQTLTLARGTLSLRANGAGLKAGRVPLRVTLSPSRGLRFDCGLLKDGAPYQGYSRLASRMLSFPLRRGKDRYLGLVAGFARGRALALRLARELHRHKKLRWPVRLHGINDAGAVVGEATLVHVADPR